MESLAVKNQFFLQRKTRTPFALLPIFGNIMKTLEGMGRNTSVSLGDHFESFVDEKVSEGRFKNASEVIRAGLRLLEEEENKVLALKKAIQEGIDSGVVRNFDPETHLQSLKARKKDG